jgi:hypothetical protein
MVTGHCTLSEVEIILFLLFCLPLRPFDFTLSPYFEPLFTIDVISLLKNIFRQHLELYYTSCSVCLFLNVM